jgi:putative ABC transport system permease protein
MKRFLRDSFVVRSLRRSPGLAVLMTVSLAFGVAAWQSGTLLADRIARPDRPLADDLYLVMFDDGNPSVTLTEPMADSKQTDRNLVVFVYALLAHADVDALQRSPTPTRSTPSMETTLLLGSGADGRPARVRLCGADLFALFGLELVRGSSWTAADERDRRPVAVISAAEARTRFGTVDAVGRTVLVGGRPLTVVGVVDLPSAGRTYDLLAAIEPPEAAFVPWTLGAELGAEPTRVLVDHSSWQSYAERAATGTQFIALWVELPGERRARFAAEMAAYAAARSRPGWPPARVWLMPLPQFHRMAGGMLEGVATWRSIALVILLACGLNVGRLLLARTLTRTAEIALMRTLGASRLRVFLRCEAEALLLGLAATIVALPVSLLLVAIVRAIMPMLDVPLQLHSGDLLSMLVLALAVSAVAGLLPALYAARLQPRALRGHA